jgi:hypothetical protein
MQELTGSIKRPNLRIIGIEEGEEMQSKGIHDMFNKITTENFPNLEREMPILVQEVARTLNRLDQNRTTPYHIISKTASTENRERILKSVREKKQITYKCYLMGKPINISADFSTENLKARRAWSEVFLALNENNFNHNTLPSKTITQNRWSNKSLPQ